MEPLRSLNGDYFIVLSVEKQSEVLNMSLTEFNNATMNVKFTEEMFNKTQFKKKEFFKKENDGRIGAHYGNPSHTKETYFKLYDYPEWFT